MTVNASREPPDPARVFARLRRIRRRRVHFRRALLAFVACMALASVSALLLRAPWISEAFAVLASVAGACAFIAALYLTIGPCPRCRLWLCGAWLYRNPAARQCIHCGLSLTYNPGFCEKCGYDLRNLPEPRCPECGMPFDPTAFVA